MAMENPPFVDNFTISMPYVGGFRVSHVCFVLGSFNGAST